MMLRRLAQTMCGSMPRTEVPPMAAIENGMRLCGGIPFFYLFI